MCEHFSVRENEKPVRRGMPGRLFVLHGGTAVVLVAVLRPDLGCGRCDAGMCVAASASSVCGTAEFRQWPTACDYATVHIEQHPAAF